MPTYTQGDPEGGSKHLPPGIYTARIYDAEETTTKETFRPMIKLHCRIYEPDGSPGPTIKENLVFSESAAWKIDTVLLAIGQEVVKGRELEVVPSQFLHAEAQVEIEDDPKNAKYSRIKRWIRQTPATVDMDNMCADAPAPPPQENARPF